MNESTIVTLIDNSGSGRPESYTFPSGEYVTVERALLKAGRQNIVNDPSRYSITVNHEPIDDLDDELPNQAFLSISSKKSSGA